MRQTNFGWAQKHGKQIAITSIASVLVVANLLVLQTAIVSAQTVVPPAAPAGSSLEQRVAQRKAEKPVTLEQRDQQRIISQCTNAQSKLRALKQQSTTVIDNRVKIYRQVDAKLWITIGKLKLAGKDTFELEKQRNALAQSVATFQSTAQQYQQVLDDAALINCKSDPAGFKSLLETARDYRKALRSQITQIREAVVNQIKPILNNFSTELQGKASTDNANTQSGGSTD